MKDWNIGILALGFVTLFVTLFGMLFSSPTDYQKFKRTGELHFVCNIYAERNITDEPIKAYIVLEDSITCKFIFNHLEDKDKYEILKNDSTGIVIQNRWQDWEFIFEHERLKMVIQTIYEDKSLGIKGMKIHFPQ